MKIILHVENLLSTVDNTLEEVCQKWNNIFANVRLVFENSNLESLLDVYER